MGEKIELLKKNMTETTDHFHLAIGAHCRESMLSVFSLHEFSPDSAGP